MSRLTFSFSREKHNQKVIASIYERRLFGSGWFHEKESYWFEDIIDENRTLFMGIKSEDITTPFTVVIEEDKGLFSFDTLLWNVNIAKSQIRLDYTMPTLGFILAKGFKYEEVITCLENVSKIGWSMNVTKEDPEQTPLELEDHWIFLSRTFDFDRTLEELISKGWDEFESLINEIINSLKGFPWNSDYETSEKLFCTELLKPLFQKMKFNSVEYSHGPTEFGKDFILKKNDEFGIEKIIAVQVKAGNLSGNSTSKLNEIFYQIEDAFQVPFQDVVSAERRHISRLFVIISGKFTYQAKEKILSRIKAERKGLVSFLDRDAIEGLVENYLRT